MSQPPATPRIYHITHVDNLPGIIQSGAILSDSAMIAGGAPVANIGMSSIKARRLTLPVDCHQGDCVGEYAPFNFCPRSVMLNVIYYANHPQLTYRGGQGSIVHLEADFHEAVAWANAANRRWAFTTANAGAVYTDFFSDVACLDEVEWAAVATNDFRSSDVKEGKQAEFLMHGAFPWELVQRIGVRSVDILTRAEAALVGAAHHPVVQVMPGWYF